LKEKHGKTPLHLVCENKSLFEPRDAIKCIDILLKSDSEEVVNACDNFNKTPLHYAIEAGTPNPRIVELLISNGGDVKAVDVYGKTPFHYTNINPLKSPAYPVTIS
jgi:ankyrin repeat protein